MSLKNADGSLPFSRIGAFAQSGKPPYANSFLEMARMCCDRANLRATSSNCAADGSARESRPRLQRRRRDHRRQMGKRVDNEG